MTTGHDGSPVQDRHSDLVRNATRLLLLASATLALNCASVPTAGPGATVDLRGVIRDPDGVPVRGVRVFLDPADDDKEVGFAATTNGKGFFHARVRPRSYAVSIWAWHTRVPDVTLDTISLRPPGQRFDYRYRGLKIQGRFLGPGGRPVKSGTILALGRYPHGSDVSLEARIVDGRFTLFGPPSGYLFSCSPSRPQYPSVEAWIPVSADTTVDFSADGKEVVGKVVLGDEPIGGADVGVYGRHVTARDRTRSDGSFRVYLPPGEYSFHVEPGPSHAFIEDASFVRTVPINQPVRLDMWRTEWRGVVSDSMKGSPVRSIKVVASQPRFHRFSVTSLSDKKGRFRLVLRTGVVYELSLSSGKRGRVPQRIADIRAGRDSTFDLRARVEDP